MVEFSKALDETVKFMEQKVLNVKPFGFDAERFSKYEGETSFRDSTPANRVFEVSLSDEPSEPLMLGSNTQDYNVIIDVVVCYEYYKSQKFNARRDYAAIRDKFVNADVSSLYQYGFHYFWIDAERYEINNENNMMYLVIPVIARYTVTRV